MTAHPSSAATAANAIMNDLRGRSGVLDGINDDVLEEIEEAVRGIIEEAFGGGVTTVERSKDWWLKQALEEPRGIIAAGGQRTLPAGHLEFLPEEFGTDPDVRLFKFDKDSGWRRNPGFRLHANSYDSIELAWESWVTLAHDIIEADDCARADAELSSAVRIVNRIARQSSGQSKRI